MDGREWDDDDAPHKHSLPSHRLLLLAASFFLLFVPCCISHGMALLGRHVDALYSCPVRIVLFLWIRCPTRAYILNNQCRSVSNASWETFVVAGMNTAPFLISLIAVRHFTVRRTLQWNPPKDLSAAELARAFRGLEGAKPMGAVFHLTDPSAPSFRFPVIEQKRPFRMMKEAIQSSIGVAVLRVAPTAVGWLLLLNLVIVPLLSSSFVHPWNSLILTTLREFYNVWGPARSVLMYTVASSTVGIAAVTLLLLAFAIPSVLLSEHIALTKLTNPALDEAAETEKPNTTAANAPRAMEAPKSLQRVRVAPYIDALASSDQFRRIHAAKDILIGASFCPNFRRELFQDSTRDAWKDLFFSMVTRIDDFTQHLQLRAASLGDTSLQSSALSSADLFFGKSKSISFSSDMPRLSFTASLGEVIFCITSCSRLIVASRSEDNLGVVNVSRSLCFFLESLVSLQLVLDTLLGGSLSKRQLDGSLPAVQRNADANLQKAARATLQAYANLNCHLLILPLLHQLSAVCSEAIHAAVLEFYEDFFKLHDFRPDHQKVLQYYADMLMN
jgi:hypothetical protein